MPWHCSLLVGVLPFLVLGFTASALANQLVFVAWGVAAAAVHAGLVRHGWRAGWRRAVLAAAVLATLAAGAGTFALLVARHREILDLGFRALLPALYHPALTRPALGYALALALALTAASLFLVSRIRGRS